MSLYYVPVRPIAQLSIPSRESDAGPEDVERIEEDDCDAAYDFYAEGE